MAHPCCRIRQLLRQDLLCHGVEDSCPDLMSFELPQTCYSEVPGNAGDLICMSGKPQNC